MKTDWLDVVDNLNSKVYDIFGDNYHYEREFSYLTNGHVDVVYFGEIVLHNSEDDERVWDEKKQDYEPSEEYLIRQLKKELDKIKEVGDKLR